MAAMTSLIPLHATSVIASWKAYLDQVIDVALKYVCKDFRGIFFEKYDPYPRTNKVTLE